MRPQRFTIANNYSCAANWSTRFGIRRFASAFNCSYFTQFAALSKVARREVLLGLSLRVFLTSKIVCCTDEILFHSCLSCVILALQWEIPGHNLIQIGR